MMTKTIVFQSFAPFVAAVFLIPPKLKVLALIFSLAICRISICTCSFKSSPNFSSCPRIFLLPQ